MLQIIRGRVICDICKKILQWPFPCSKKNVFSYLQIILIRCFLHHRWRCSNSCPSMAFSTMNWFVLIVKILVRAWNEKKVMSLTRLAWIQIKISKKSREEWELQRRGNRHKHDQSQASSSKIFYDRSDPNLRRFRHSWRNSSQSSKNVWKVKIWGMIKSKLDKSRSRCPKSCSRALAE